MIRCLLIIALIGFLIGISEVRSEQLWQFGGNPYTPYSDRNPYSNTANPYNPEGLRNPYSQYGNPYSTTGRLNPYGDGMRVDPIDSYRYDRDSVLND